MRQTRPWSDVSAFAEHKRRMIGLERQRLVIGFQRRHFDQRARAGLSGGDLL
jgi:hypothetical protein